MTKAWSLERVENLELLRVIRKKVSDIGKYQLFCLMWPRGNLQNGLGFRYPNSLASVNADE